MLEICKSSTLWDYLENKPADNNNIYSNQKLSDNSLRFRCKCNHFPFAPYTCIDNYCNSENIYNLGKLQNKKCICRGKVFNQKLLSSPCTMCPWRLIPKSVMKGSLICQTKNSSFLEFKFPLCPPELYGSEQTKMCIPFDIFYSIEKV